MKENNKKEPVMGFESRNQNIIRENVKKSRL